MGKAPAFPFYVKDWLSDSQLKMASHAAKGVWIDMLCFMWDAPERGQLSGTSLQLQRMVGATVQDFEQFINDANTLCFCDISVTDNGIVTVRNRRMWREGKDRDNNRIRQQRHREKHKNNEEVTPPFPFPIPFPSKISSSHPAECDPKSHQELSSKKVKIFPVDSPAYRLSDFLLSLISARNPQFREPNLQEWARHIDLMLRIDGREERTIAVVIEWAQADPFWQNNILSAAKLRKQFDQLFMRMQKDTQS